MSFVRAAIGGLALFFFAQFCGVLPLRIQARAAWAQKKEPPKEKKGGDEKSPRDKTDAADGKNVP